MSRASELKYAMEDLKDDLANAMAGQDELRAERNAALDEVEGLRRQVALLTPEEAANKLGIFRNILGTWTTVICSVNPDPNTPGNNLIQLAVAESEERP